MTLLWIEGAGIDTTTWDTMTGARSASVGRYGDAGIIGFGDTANAGGKTITPSAEVYVGFAHYCATDAPNSGNRVVTFWTVDGEQTRVWLASVTELRASRLDGTQLATYTTATVRNRWVYYEVYFKCANSGGRITVKMDGVTVIDFTGDTKNTGSGSDNITSVSFSGTGGSTSSFLDDVYICNGLGTVNNTFLGEVRVVPMVTTGAGSSTQFTPTSGSNWDTVNDTGTDTTYNSSSTPGQRDTYNVTDVTVGTVHGIQTSTRVKKLDVGSGLIKPAIKSGSTLAYGTTRTALATATSYLDLWETDPATTAAWTQSAINALEIGAEIVSAAPTVPAPIGQWMTTEGSGTSVADSSGYGATGTMWTPATWATGGSGLHSHAVLVGTGTSAGGGGHKPVECAAGTTPVMTSAITVMCQVKMDTTDTGPSYQTIFGKSTSSYDTYGLYGHYGGSRFYAAAQFNLSVGGGFELLDTTARLGDNAWHHVAATYDGATVKLYVDGTLRNSVSKTGTLVYASDVITLISNARYGNELKGGATEFRIYNVALTQAEITVAMAG